MIILKPPCSLDLITQLRRGGTHPLGFQLPHMVKNGSLLTLLEKMYWLMTSPLLYQVTHVYFADQKLFY